jgi:hypothetical protein
MSGKGREAPFKVGREGRGASPPSQPPHRNSRGFRRFSRRRAATPSATPTATARPRNTGGDKGSARAGFAWSAGTFWAKLQGGKTLIYIVEPNPPLKTAPPRRRNAPALRGADRRSRGGRHREGGLRRLPPVALLTPEALLKAGLRPAAKILDLKGRLRCRGCGRKGRAVVWVKWRVQGQ